MELKFNLPKLDTQELREEMAKRIRVRKAELSMSTKELRKLTGLTGKTLVDLENAKGNPSTENLYKVMRALGMKL